MFPEKFAEIFYRELDGYDGYTILCNSEFYITEKTGAKVTKSKRAKIRNIDNSDWFFESVSFTSL